MAISRVPVQCWQGCRTSWDSCPIPWPFEYECEKDEISSWHRSIVGIFPLSFSSTDEYLPSSSFVRILCPTGEAVGNARGRWHKGCGLANTGVCCPALRFLYHRLRIRSEISATISNNLLFERERTEYRRLLPMWLL